jgi:hypothetical protein
MPAHRLTLLRMAVDWNLIEPAPARAIQELAGHKDLATTQRCMHLSPAATTTNGAIRLLDELRGSEIFGDILETGSTKIVKSFG